MAVNSTLSFQPTRYGFCYMFVLNLPKIKLRNTEKRPADKLIMKKS